MKPVTVTQLNEYIADKLRNDFRLKQLPVEGEISQVTLSGRNRYITLKDQGSLIKCVIWENNARKIDLSLIENGKKVIVIGDISPYPKGGYYSFSITHVEAAGEGALMAEFNRVKKMLEAEGLFDSKWKKPIPEFPKCIGVVTSDTGAAVEDIKKIITSKNDLTDIIIFPTIVQGIAAPSSICHSIELANELVSEGMCIDTLIVGRGGGSAEDLAAFNDESVARAIFASQIPVISAVGHESDISISDFVADVRAETPTAAADMAVMDTHELRNRVEDYRKALISSATTKIENEKTLLQTRTELLYSNIRNKVNDARNSIEKAMIIMRENHPDKVFSKGYAAVIDDNGRVIPEAAQISVGSEYTIKMRDGSFNAVVNDVNVNKKTK